MTRDEFIAEYHKVSAKAIQLSKKARNEGLLAMEELINQEKLKKRDILEYGLRFVIDGTDESIIEKILSNIIQQEEDKYTRILMEIKKESVLSIQAGDNPRIIICKLNSLTDLTLTDDPNFQESGEEDEKGALTDDEIDGLIGGLK
jgi:flagellar motor component MotA